MRSRWITSQINFRVLRPKINTFWKEAEANVPLIATEQLDTTSVQISSRLSTQQEIHSF